ncbi:MAG: hypothetical protein UT24_C0037G0002 [Candidatus Woesebacteria bacterium GW2011_GWB1_39_12]|uniref:Uncharacterized protein n=1 Tax=Candidatus Woesebacteria bacterium GW2011_GWB1_39_12 TaxID=1618574 RepID=A0A0G0M3A7_9BACT|nr:MAG: hypothetical protein UT24_C0037G0002 [Candidatus Woesebacteria bacterium GW2011_GWB1_39_12]
MTQEEHESIEALANQIYNLAMYNAKRDDALDNPEYLAFEIISLSEYMADSPEHARMSASIIANSYELTKGTAVEIKKYYSLAY